MASAQQLEALIAVRRGSQFDLLDAHAHFSHMLASPLAKPDE